MSNPKKLVRVLLALVIGSAVLAALRNLTGEEARQPPLAKEGTYAEEVLDSGGYLTTLWLAPELHSSVRSPSANVLRLELGIDNPFDASSQLEYTATYDWSVNYDILAVAGGLGPHEFVVLGRARNADMVMERLQLLPPDGSYFYDAPQSNPPSAGIVGSGVFVPPAQRPAAAPPRREELYRGKTLGLDLIIANDPYRRLTYCISRDLQKLWEIDWDGATPIVEFPIGGDQSLLGMAQTMQIQEHQTEGIKLKVMLDPEVSSAAYILFSDYDGDALLDTHEVMTDADYDAAGYPGMWSNDFVRKLSWLLPG